MARKEFLEVNSLKKAVARIVKQPYVLGTPDKDRETFLGPKISAHRHAIVEMANNDNFLIGVFNPSSNETTPLIEYRNGKVILNRQSDRARATRLIQDILALQNG